MTYQTAIDILSQEVDDKPSAQLLALLEELRAMLEKLVNTGIASSIDIRSLPLLPGDYECLKTLLGTGEVTVTVNVLGPSYIKETGVPGIWWVTHCNADDSIMAELVEVASVPEILATKSEEFLGSIAQLDSMIKLM